MCERGRSLRIEINLTEFRCAPQPDNQAFHATASHLHCTAGSSRSFTAIRKDEGLCCGSRLRKGEVFAYVGSIQNLKDLKGTPCTGVPPHKKRHRPLEPPYGPTCRDSPAVGSREALFLVSEVPLYDQDHHSIVFGRTAEAVFPPVSHWPGRLVNRGGGVSLQWSPALIHLNTVHVLGHCPWKLHEVPGYLAHKKAPLPRTFRHHSAKGPIVTLLGEALSYERNTPVVHTASNP